MLTQVRGSSFHFIATLYGSTRKLFVMNVATPALNLTGIGLSRGRTPENLLFLTAPPIPWVVMENLYRTAQQTYRHSVSPSQCSPGRGEAVCTPARSQTRTLLWALWHSSPEARMVALATTRAAYQETCLLNGEITPSLPTCSASSQHVMT